MFDNLIAQSKVATDPIRKAFLIRQAVKLYKGNVFPEAETEEWLRPVSMQYLERYLAAIYKLCDFSMIRKITPGSMNMSYRHSRQHRKRKSFTTG